MSVHETTVALAAITLVTLLAVATTAHATSGDVVVVTDQGSTSSVPSKGLMISCPSGTHVLGSGGFVFNGARRVHLANTAPVDGGVNWTQWVVGRERDPPQRLLRQLAPARLRRLRTLAARPGVRLQQSLENSTSTRHARVTCPGTKRLLAAGGEVADQPDRVVLDDISMTSDLKSVDVWGIEREGGTTGTWSVGAYGVCVSSAAVTNLHLVQSPSVPRTSATRSGTPTASASRSTGSARARRPRRGTR